MEVYASRRVAILYVLVLVQFLIYDLLPRNKCDPYNVRAREMQRWRWRCIFIWKEIINFRPFGTGSSSLCRIQYIPYLTATVHAIVHLVFDHLCSMVNAHSFTLVAVASALVCLCGVSSFLRLLNYPTYNLILDKILSSANTAICYDYIARARGCRLKITDRSNMLF